MRQACAAPASCGRLPRQQKAGWDRRLWLRHHALARGKKALRTARYARRRRTDLQQAPDKYSVANPRGAATEGPLTLRDGHSADSVTASEQIPRGRPHRRPARAQQRASVPSTAGHPATTPPRSSLAPTTAGGQDGPAGGRVLGVVARVVRVDQLFLGAEVVVRVAGGHPGFLRDGPHGGGLVTVHAK
jgi:hypothetical protein